MGICYVLLTLAVLLAHNNHVDTVDMAPGKVKVLARWEGLVKDGETGRLLA